MECEYHVKVKHKALTAGSVRSGLNRGICKYLRSAECTQLWWILASTHCSTDWLCLELKGAGVEGVGNILSCKAREIACQPWRRVPSKTCVVYVATFTQNKYCMLHTARLQLMLQAVISWVMQLAVASVQEFLSSQSLLCAKNCARKTENGETYIEMGEFCVSYVH